MEGGVDFLGTQTQGYVSLLTINIDLQRTAMSLTKNFHNMD